MSEPIKPAMTAEEWAAWLNEDDANGLGHGRYELHHQPDVTTHEVRRYSDGIMCTTGQYVGEEFSPDEQDQHAIAAMALYGAPFGFRMFDPTDLEYAANVVERMSAASDQPEFDTLNMNVAKSLRTLAAKIAALLPPD